MWILGIVAAASAAPPEPVWTIREGATQWVSPAVPAWPQDDEGQPLRPAGPGVRCEVLLSVDLDTGEVTRSQVQGCAEPWATATGEAVSTWQARVRAGEQGVRGVRAGVTWVSDPTWQAPVGRTGIELRLWLVAPKTCVGSVEVSADGHARVVAATHPDCVQLPSGNKWAANMPRTGTCTVVPDSPPTVVSCDPQVLAEPIVGVLDGRISISRAWGERTLQVHFGQPVASTRAQVTLTPTVRVAPTWDVRWLEDPPTDRADCTIEVTIDSEGNPADPRVWSCTDPWATRALDAVARWRWKPPTRDGTPARVALSVPIVFELGTALPTLLSRERYLSLKGQTTWLLDQLDAEDCAIRVETDGSGKATLLAASQIPECLVAPGPVDLQKWRRKAAGPETCSIRVQSDDGVPTVLSIGECSDELRKVVEGSGLQGWLLESPSEGARLYDLQWMVRPQ